MAVKTAGQWNEAIWQAARDVDVSSRSLQKKMRFEEQIPGSKALSPEQAEEMLRPYRRRLEKLDWAKRLGYVLRAMELDGPDPDLWYRVERIVEDIMSEQVEVQR